MYLAGVLEYLAAELVEISGNVARDDHKARITPRHIAIAVRDDEEVSQLFGSGTIVGGGVLPNIHSALLPKKRAPPGRKLWQDVWHNELLLVLSYLPLAHDIALAAMVCRSFRDAARQALAARPYSGEVVTLPGVRARFVGATADGCVITCSQGHHLLEPGVIKLWHDRVCVRTIQAGGMRSNAALLPGGRVAAETVAGNGRSFALWTLSGTHERNIDLGAPVHAVASLPDGVHFVIGTGSWLEMYHIDGTHVHTFTGHTNNVLALAVTPDGQHIISGSADSFVKVWSVASRSLVSTSAEHTARARAVVRAVAVTPDGQRILSGSLGEIRVLRLDGTHENTFMQPRTWVTDLVALPDNLHALFALPGLWSSSPYGLYPRWSSGLRRGLQPDPSQINLFNMNDGTILRAFPRLCGLQALSSLALMPDGRRFVIGVAVGDVHILEHGLAT